MPPRTWVSVNRRVYRRPLPTGTPVAMDYQSPRVIRFISQPYEVTEDWQFDFNPFSYELERWWPPAGNRYYTYRCYQDGKKTLDEMRGVADYLSPSLETTVKHLTTGSKEVSDAELIDKCMRKAYDKLKENNLNLAVDIAESAATLKMLKATLSFKKLAAEFFNELLLGKKDKLKRMGIRKRMDYATGKWLEYRYGWLPLVSTVHDGMELIANAHFREPEMFIKTRSGRVGKTSVIARIDDSWNIPTAVINTEWSKRAQMIAYFQPEDGVSLNMLTSLNPATIAWELVPFSFVFDWFVNIGDLLEQMDNYYRFRQQFRRGVITISEKVQTERVSYGSTTYKPLQPNMCGLEGPARHNARQALETVSSRRTIMTSWPMWRGVPKTKLRLNTKQQTDAIALIWSIFNKGKTDLKRL